MPQPPLKTAQRHGLMDVTSVNAEREEVGHYKEHRDNERAHLCMCVGALGQTDV